MAKTILLRCKTPSGPVQINNLTDQDKVRDLKATLSSLTGISRLKILFGYPPKELVEDDNSLLGSIFKSLRESLIVSENLSNVKGKGEFKYNLDVNHQNVVIEKTNGHLISSNLNGLNKNSGRLLRKVVPANNSCLFTAVYFCVSNGKFNPNIGQELRKLIVSKVKENPIQFNDAILGLSSKEYCDKIVKEDVWGGSIELAILSDYYSLEIVAVDTQNVRLNRFGEDKNYSSRIILIYDGIHYDSLYFERFNNKEPVTIFSTKNSELLNMALEVASEAKKAGQYTDVKNFKLRCLVCNDKFKGSQEANEHAKKTGHINFGEF